MQGEIPTEKSLVISVNCYCQLKRHHILNFMGWAIAFDFR